MRISLLLGVVVVVGACTGPQGEPGPAGANGMNGTNGTNGADGRDGTDGTNGSNGTNGTNGTNGDAGLSAWVTASGVHLSLTSISFDAGRPTVEFEVSDGEGTPLDLAGRLTAGRVQVAFLLAGGGIDGGVVGPWAPSSALGLPGVVTALDVSQGRYAFVASSADPTLAAAAHRLAVATATRVVGADAFIDSASFATAPRAIADQSRCESCHGGLRAHAEQFDELQQCLACHTVGTLDAGLAFDGLMHRVHAGAALPSVVAGQPLRFVAADGGVHDYSTVVFPRSLEHCAACHAGTAVGDVWKSRPSLEACTSCHDRTAFSTTPPVGFTAHAPATNAQCSTCHTATVLEGQHAHPSFDGGVPSLEVVVQAVANSGGGQTANVTFRVTVGGAPRNIMNDPLTTLRFNLAGPNTDFATTASATAQGSGASGTLTSIDAPNGVFNYTFPFSAAIPSTATGSYSVAAEGSLVVGLDRAAVRSTPFAFAVTDPTPVPRRAIIDPAKCDGCHLSLVAHSSVRGAAGCPMCHRAALDNSTRVRRFEGEAVQAESTDFKVMIHKIHRGEHLAQPYVLYGFPAPTKASPLGTPRDFGAVRSPRSTADCDSCHVSPQTWALPLGPLAPTTRRTFDCTEDPAADTDAYCDQRVLSATANIPPESAVCTSCHDQPWVVAHAQINTSLAGVESCTTCHGLGGQAQAH